MGNLRPGLWHLILVHILLLHIQPMLVQGVDHVSQKLRRLTEQFHQFQVLTQARLDMLALNQDRRNSSWLLESRVQALNDRLLQTSLDLKDLKQSSRQEIGGLREWGRKLERKSKRLEGRVALMDQKLRESRRFGHKQEVDPGQDFSTLTLELQSQEERLAALQAQRDELLIGMRGLQESLKNQVLRVTQLEGRLGEVLQIKTGEFQKYNEPGRRSLTNRGGGLERFIDGQTQSRPERLTNLQTENSSKATAENRNPQQPNQYQGTPNKPKYPKAQKSRPQPESHPHVPYHPQSQIQVRAKTRTYPAKQEELLSHQTVPDLHTQIQPLNQQPSQSNLKNHRHHSSSHPLSQTETVPKPTNERYGGGEQVNDSKVESSVIHSMLQLPVRQKIPAKPVPKKDATICNVDSMLFFPTASAENYVTFSSTLPDLHELSVCLWLRVEAQHIGTLLSYATEDNDNQLVLYGHGSSSSSASFSSSLLPSSPSSSPSSSSSSLEFVIGDPVYRRLPVWSLLDARWHHLCILWSSIQGRFWHYSDKHLISSGSNFRKGWEVPGGGSVVLGQEQDIVAGGFDAAEGFAGQLAGFRMWNRVLSPAEVEGVAEGRGVPRGMVLGMEHIKELHGEVQQVSCECLEHCV